MTAISICVIRLSPTLLLLESNVEVIGKIFTAHKERIKWQSQRG